MRAAVNGDRMNDGASGATKGLKDRCDRGHAAIEDDRTSGPSIEGNDLILEDFGVRMRKARVDQLDIFVRCRAILAECDSESAFRGLWTRKDIGRTAKYRWTD